MQSSSSEQSREPAGRRLGDRLATTGLIAGMSVAYGVIFAVGKVVLLLPTGVAAAGSATPATSATPAIPATQTAPVRLPAGAPAPSPLATAA